MEGGTDVTRQIAEYVAALVEDGSTLEFGIGSIPQKLQEFLRSKKDLGIHTEMLTDGIKAQDKEEEIAQRDIAEILADAIELDEVEQTPVAAE